MAVSKRDVEQGLRELRETTGLNLLLNDVPREYGLRLMGAQVGPGLVMGAWLSPKFKNLDELFNWMHGFAQGWVMKASGK